MYLSRKKIIEHKLKHQILKMKMQQEVLNAIIDTTEQEHIRVARDLHDEISSKLSAIQMNIHLLKRKNLKEEDRDEISNYTLEACGKLIDSTRRISHNLMPPALEHIGLDQSIDELCREFTMSGKVEITYTNTYQLKAYKKLNHGNQVHVYRIIQELINNSLRHGKAEEISIEISMQNEVTTMIYLDNGTGITPSKLSTGKGIGLNNITARATIIKGEVKFDLKHQNGFRFLLTF